MNLIQKINERITNGFHRKIRVCEFIYSYESLLCIIDVSITKNGKAETRVCHSIEQLADISHSIDALILSGERILIVNPEDEDETLPEGKTYYIHSDNKSGFKACVKRKHLDTLSEILDQRGFKPQGVYLAPFHFENHHDNYLRIETSTWILKFSGQKLIEIESKECDLDKLVQNYPEELACKLIKNKDTENMKGVEGIQTIQKNRILKKEKKQITGIFAGIFFLMILLYSIEIVMNSEFDEITRLNRECIELNKRIEDLSKKKKQIDSTINSRINKGNSDFAFRFDRVASLKPPNVKLYRTYFQIQPQSEKSKIQIRGSTDNPESLTNWVSVMRKELSVDGKITSLKQEKGLTNFILTL